MLVAFEGIDACGKSTQIELLKKAALLLFQGGCQVFSYPNYLTDTGKKILQLLKDPNRDPLVLQCLMTVNRYEEQFLVEEALSSGTLVILDRYWLSGLVYGVADGLPPGWLHQIHAQLLAPDHWFVLDISVAESFRRRPVRDEDYEGNKERLLLARHLYAGRGSTLPNRYLLDGEDSIQAIHEQILKVIGSGR